MAEETNQVQPHCSVTPVTEKPGYFSSAATHETVHPSTLVDSPLEPTPVLHERRHSREEEEEREEPEARQGEEDQGEQEEWGELEGEGQEWGGGEEEGGERVVRLGEAASQAGASTALPELTATANSAAPPVEPTALAAAPCPNLADVRNLDTLTAWADAGLRTASPKQLAVLGVVAMVVLFYIAQCVIFFHHTNILTHI